MINVGIVGCGYWGPKLIRNFYELPDSNLALVCDLDVSKLQQIKKQYPHVETTSDFNDLIQDGIDAVVIATPVNTHFKLVKEALNHHKHVLVEKPMTASSQEARELIELAGIKIALSVELKDSPLLCKRPTIVNILLPMRIF